MSDLDRNRLVLDKVYNPADKAEQIDGYDQWAADYDKDLWSYGYISPGLAAALIERHGGRSLQPILDVGCGTGLVGEYLGHLGYDAVDGLDLSQGMLDAAASKEVYRALYRMKIGETLDIESDSYGCIVTTGTFTVGHVGPEGYAELIRICRPGGLIVHSNRFDKEPETGFGAHHAQAEADGLWTLVEHTDDFVCMPFGEPDVTHRMFVHRVA
jgi:SAM-dependent methyltransferase